MCFIGFRSSKMIKVQREKIKTKLLDKIMSCYFNKFVICLKIGWVLFEGAIREKERRCWWTVKPCKGLISAQLPAATIIWIYSGSELGSVQHYFSGFQLLFSPSSTIWVTSATPSPIHSFRAAFLGCCLLWFHSGLLGLHRCSLVWRWVCLYCLVSGLRVVLLIVVCCCSWLPLLHSRGLLNPLLKLLPIHVAFLLPSCLNLV